MRVLTACLFGVAFLVLGIETVAQDRLYRIGQVTTAKEAKACYDAKGLGAMLFTLDTDGNPEGPVGAFCIIPAK